MIYFKRKNLWKRLFLGLSELKLPSCRLFTGFFKFISVVSILIVILVYSLYLFYLPKYVTDEKVEGCLNNYLKNNTKLTLNIEKLAIQPDYKFDIKLNADKITLLYPDKKQFVILEKPDIEINLLTLFLNYIDLNKIKAKKITINTNFTKNNRYDCFNYFDFDFLDFKNSKFNLRNIRIICDELVFNLFDENVKRNYKLQTKKLTFYSNDIKESFFIQTKGIVSGADKISDFKLNLEINSQKEFLNNFKKRLIALNYNPLIHASKFKFYFGSDIDLKVKNSSVSGYINLSDLSFVIDNIQIPKNNLSMVFKGSKIKVQGDFNLIKNQFIKLNINADYSKNKFVELKLNSSEINLSDLKRIASSVSKILNLKYNFDFLEAEGTTSADIYLKSNFKNIVSSGFANIKNTKIKDKNTGLILTDINSEVSFNNNKINISKATAVVDNSKFHLEGDIDNKTNLNLKINSDPINVAQILNTARHLPVISKIIPELNDYIFQSGFVKTNATIKGTLINPLIETNSHVSNLKLYIKSLNSLITSNEIIIEANPKNYILKEVFITAKNNLINYGSEKITNSYAKLKISDNDILIDKTSVTFDNIKADIKGIIKNYRKNPVIQMNISALLPLKNELIVIKGKTPQIFADVEIEKNRLSVKNAKVSDSAQNHLLATVSGDIYDYSSQNPKFENFKISLPDKISCILPKADDLSFDATGDLTVFGTLYNPVITGVIRLYNVEYKKYDLFIQDCNLTLKNSNLEGNMASLDIMRTTLYDVIFKGNIEEDILKIAKFSADIFEGEVSGRADINLKNFKTETELILKEISVRHLSSYLKQYSIAVSGRLSALSRLSFTGIDYDSAINSLKGYIKFNIDNGELSQFAKLERFLQAGNILSQSILKLTLNSIISSITKQNTGYFKTIEGTVKINSPDAEIQYINTQGENMSMHIEGKYNIINNRAILRVLGKIPLNIVSVMGNIGKFSLSKLMDTNPAQSAVERMMSTYISDDESAKIPSLANERADTQTREFIVIIDGLLNNNSAVKYFKWGVKK